MTRYQNGQPNLPLYSLVAAVVFVVTGAGLAVFAPENNQNAAMLIALLVSTLPSLVAALFAERSSRDIRNGVMTEKAREGASQAIQEHGVVTRDGPAATASIQALTELLKQRVANEAAKGTDPNTEGDPT